MAHACNPSCSGGRDQEDQGSNLVWANSLQDPILKKPTKKKKKKGWWSGFKPQYWGKKKKKKERHGYTFHYASHCP
jgi:hypothetical protein